MENTRKDLIRRLLEECGAGQPRPNTDGMSDLQIVNYVLETCGLNPVMDTPITSIPDSVNHPTHYNSHPSGVEVITITRHESFNVGNAIKYLLRRDLKGGEEDLRKAVWYILDEIGRLYNYSTEDAKSLVKISLDHAKAQANNVA